MDCPYFGDEMTPQPLRSPFEGEAADPIGGEGLHRPRLVLWLFVSLPPYAETERRHIVSRLSGLNHAFAGAVRIEPFGPGIEAVADDGTLGAADCDAVIAVLRPRFPDDPEIAEQAGARGGAAGLVSAMGKGGAAGLPDIHIFRYAESPDQAAADTDWQGGKRAFEAWFRARGGQGLSFDDFSSADGFAARLDERLGSWLTGLGFEPPPISKPAADIVAFAAEIAETPLPAAEPAETAEPEPETAEEPPAAEVMPEIEPAPAPEIFSTIPAHEESAEVVRRDRFRRLTNFLYRRQTTYTPPEEDELEPALEPSPETADLTEIPEEPVVDGPFGPEEFDKAAAEDDGILILEGEFIDLTEGEAEFAAPAAFLDELEPLPKISAEEGDPGLDPAFGDAADENDSTLIIESTLVEPVALLDELEPVPDIAAQTQTALLEPVPEDLATELAEPAAEPELPPEAPVVAVLPRPEPAPPEPVIETAAVTGGWGGRGALLAMTLLTASSLVFAGFAGVMWVGARSTADRAQKGLAAATETAGNLVFNLTEEGRRLGGATSDGSKAIVEDAQKLHGALLAKGSIDADALFAQADTKKNAALALMKQQDKLADALKLALEGQRLFQSLVDLDPTKTESQKWLASSHEATGDILVVQNNLVEALGAYRDDIAIRKVLSAKDPDSVDMRVDLSSAQMKAADVMAARGRLEDAQSTYRDALAIRKTLAQGYANIADRQRDLMEIDNKLADVLAAQNRLDDALAVYRDALGVTTRMALMNPADPKWRAASAKTDNKIGDVLVGKGRVDDALASYRDGLATMKDVAANEPSNSEWQGSLAAIHERIGDAFVTESHFESALASYRDALGIIQAMVAKEPKSASWRHAASEAQLRIGQVLFSQNNLDGSLAAHRESLNIMKALAAEEPDNSRYQHDLMMNDNDIGIILNQKGVRAEALAAYRDAQQIAAAMGAKEPGNPDWPTTRAMIDNNLGSLQMDLGNRDDGIASYRDGLEVSKGLVARDPRNAEWQSALAVALYNLGEAGVDSEANFVQARDLLVRLDNAGALRPDKKALIPHVEEALAKLRGADARKRR